MKNILLLLSVIITSVVLFSSCDPTKDFKDEYSKYNNPNKVKFPDTTTVYTLTTADYLNSSVSDISKNKNFSDANPANPNLLEILNKKYNAKMAASLTVTYNYYNPLVLRDSVTYTLVNADYGNKYNDFINATDLTNYLAKTYPQARRGKVAILTYNWLTSTSVVTNTFVCLSPNTWIIVTQFALADYKIMGQSYANFSNTTDPLYYIPIYLKNTKAYAKSGDITMVQYAVYASSKTTQYLLQYTYNGSAWIPFNAVTTAATVVNFDGLLWKFPPPVKLAFATGTPANAINYTLIGADYTMVGNSYADFDRRAGQPEADDNVFLTKVGTILKTRFAASIAIGQVYAVTYADYSGSNPPPNKTVYVSVVPL